jgi:uncharacterized protein
MIETAGVESPCVGQCCLDMADICMGCFRSLDEIKMWSQANDKMRLLFIDNAKQRQSQHIKNKPRYF